MKDSGPAYHRSLFRGLVAAARSLNWRPSRDAGIIHSNAREVEWERDWDAEREETLRLVFPDDLVIHLQIRFERQGKEDRWRTIVFGRRVIGIDYTTPNTQRATFNSSNRDEAGFWLRPRLNSTQEMDLGKRLRRRGFPRWDGRHIQLGYDTPYITLRRFLIALTIIEQVKGDWPHTRLPFSAGTQPVDDRFDAGDLDELTLIQEGVTRRTAASRRSRCQRLLGEAREHFRSQRDGRLHCALCNWRPPVPTRVEVVQIHHKKQLRDYPKSGRELTLAQALANLIPLCPNCHRVLESKPGGGCYSVEELSTRLAYIYP